MRLMVFVRKISDSLLVVPHSLRPSFPPIVGITVFLFFVSHSQTARSRDPVFHNNVDGALRNLALTNGFLNILHFFIFKKFTIIITVSRFFNPSNEILLFLIFHMQHLGINSCKEHLSELAFSR